MESQFLSLPVSVETDFALYQWLGTRKADRNPGLHPGALPMNHFSSFETRFGPAVTLIQLKTHVDKRGSLYSVEFFSLPFQPQRLFFVAPSKAGEKRGGHAHETAHQLLICASGQIDIVVAYAGEEEKFCLDRPGMANQSRRRNPWPAHQVMIGLAASCQPQDDPLAAGPAGSGLFSISVVCPTGPRPHAKPPWRPRAMSHGRSFSAVLHSHH